MISPARITELLSQRTALSPEDKRLLEQAAVRYPYFAPVQLLLASQRPNPAPALQALHLNRVLTAFYLPPVKVKQPQAPAPEATPAPEPLSAETSADMKPETALEPDPLPEVYTTIAPETVAVVEDAWTSTATAAEATETKTTEMEQTGAEATSTPSAEAVSSEVNSAAEDTEILEQTNENPDVPSPLPVYTEDYFRFEGIEVGTELPAEVALQPLEQNEPETSGTDKEKSLMVMMSFTDWLLHYKKQSQSAKDEAADKQRVKSAWQREKLAAALQEEEDEIPEQVFEMAVNSLNQEEGLVSESLAAILAKQGKIEKAMEMYQKLSLKYPQKSAYFASQIEHLKREENQ